jgi:hypothetical protein
MALTMYAATVPLFTRMLTNTLGFFDKAEAYATERKFDVNILVAARLAPDMNPLSFQVQAATDRPKLALARIIGKPAPSWPDDEKTIADLRARIRKGLDYFSSLTPADLEGTDDKMIPLKIRGEDVVWPAQDYLLNNVYPNFYFHVTTAYDILRHNGVPIGKRDFVG